MTANPFRVETVFVLVCLPSGVTKRLDGAETLTALVNGFVSQIEVSSTRNQCFLKCFWSFCDFFIWLIEFNFLIAISFWVFSVHFYHSFFYRGLKVLKNVKYWLKSKKLNPWICFSDFSECFIYYKCNYHSSDEKIEVGCKNEPKHFQKKVKALEKMNLLKFVFWISALWFSVFAKTPFSPRSIYSFFVQWTCTQSCPVQITFTVRSSSVTYKSNQTHCNYAHANHKPRTNINFLVKILTFEAVQIQRER